MYKKQTLTIITMIIIATLLFGQMPLGSDKIEANIGKAAAANNQEFDIFIPISFGNYPLTTLFGVQMLPNRPALGFDQVAQTNTYWIRHNGVLWSEIEPYKGAQRDWSPLASLEQEVIATSQAGMEVLMIIRSTPSWAQKIPGSFCGPIKEQELASFGQFVYDVVNRYSQPPYNVKYWEVWNEPDVPAVPEFYDKAWGCWGDQTDDYYGGGYYAEMLKVAYPNIKAADPTAQVIIGGLLLDCDPRQASNWCAYWNHDQRQPKFLEGILRNNGGAYFDGVAFHGYDYFDYTDPELGEYYNPVWGSSSSNTLWDGSSTNRIGPVSTYKAGYIKEVLANYNVSGKFLMNTEAALICGSSTGDPGEPGCEPDDNSLFEQTKARYIPQAYAAATRDGLLANTWYNILGWRNSALLNEDLSARPAYYTYDVASQQIGGANFVRNVNTYPGVQIYEFERNTKIIWLLYSIDGASHTITLPSTPDEVKDFMGVTKTPSSTFTANLDPHYLIWYP